MLLPLTLHLQPPTYLPPIVAKCVHHDLPPVVDRLLTAEGDHGGVVHVDQAVGVDVLVKVGHRADADDHPVQGGLGGQGGGVAPHHDQPHQGVEGLAVLIPPVGQVAREVPKDIIKILSDQPKAAKEHLTM